MTTPLQESTTQRDVGGLGFATSQLARRPAPLAAGSSSYAYARFQRINDTDLTVLDSTPKQVTGTSGQDVNTDATIFQINTSSEIQMLADGLVGIWGQTVWSTYDTSFRLVAAMDVTPFPDVVLFNGGVAADNFDAVTISGVVRASTGAKIRLYVNQQSGGSKVLYGGGTGPDEINFLEVQYLGPYQ